jgi:hypothetical protein
MSRQLSQADERDPAVVARQEQIAREESGEGAAASGGFECCPEEVVNLISSALQKWHRTLFAQGVTIDAVFSRKWNKDGEPIAALKRHGIPALAKIKVTSLEDRVRGLGDAKLVIDGNAWERMSANRRLALLDHKLEHLDLAVDRDGIPKIDDNGRPKLKTKPHDWELAGFESVAKRQGENAIEVQEIAAFKERFAQLDLPI